MKRTQLQLDDHVYDALRRRAYESRSSIAGVVREALKAYLALRPRVVRMPQARRPSFVGSFRTAQRSPRPVSERHDAALARAFKH